MKVEPSARFLRDLAARGLGPGERGELRDLIELLAAGEPLPAHYREHALRAPWAGNLECHLAPDWLLIYRRTNRAVILVRTGSHAELFGKP